MKTTISQSFEISEPIHRVWEQLTTAEKVIPCVPGASLVETIDENNFKGAVRLKFGAVKTSYEGHITFLERDNENYKMVMSGKGVDSRGKGGADMVMNGLLTENGDGVVKVDCTMEVAVTGMLAQFGSRLINDVSGTVFNQFVDNFKKQLAGEEVDNSMTAGKMVGSMVKGIFKK